MTFIDPFDPMDSFLWLEFLDPDSEYECPSCGTRFGQESITRDARHRPTYTCPACGQSGEVERAQ